MFFVVALSPLPTSCSYERGPRQPRVSLILFTFETHELVRKKHLLEPSTHCARVRLPQLVNDRTAKNFFADVDARGSGNPSCFNNKEK
jgi:hypothetical protein